MRIVFILLISSLLFSCDFKQSKSPGSNLLSKNDSTVDTEKVVQLKLSTANEYHKVLDKLDHGNLSSLDLACKLFKNSVADTITRDSMLVTFSDFYNTLAESYLENNEAVSTQLQNSPSPEVLNKIKTSLAAYGIRLSSSEGAFYLEPQTEYLLQKFGSELSPAYREYLTIGSKEQKSRFAEDGTILIPSDSLSSRIMTWENFIKRYPDFISIKMAQDQYAQYMGAFLAGMDNSRIFNSATNRLNDSSKVSFESFIVKNPESISAGVVKSYLDLLKSTNFNYTDKVDSFLLEKVYH
jgi:hypothetical protein